MIRQRRHHLIAIWLGLFAMLMIHVGPLISGAQALLVADAVGQSTVASVMHHDDITHHSVEHAVAESSEVKHTDHAVDYHALMGHHSAPVGAPEWLAALEMCGYCDLLTVSPPLVLVLLLALPVLPAVQWLAILPLYIKPLTAVYRLRHPRAPPVLVFA